MSNLLRIALLVLVVGVVAIVAAPFLFTRAGIVSFTDTGEIGDTIGGITAPISSLVGAILLFLALKSQVAANSITQEQIRDQQVREEIKKEISYVSDLYKLFAGSIQAFETRYFKGYKAIMRVMNVLATSEQKRAHDDSRLYFGAVAELYNILKLGKLFLEQVNKNRIDAHDRAYFKELVKHHYDSFILPYLTRMEDEKSACEVCGEKHNGIPLKISELIKETLQLI